MPLHVYVCDACDNRFEQVMPVGTHVGTYPCVCGEMANKSWSAPDVLPAAVVDRPEYYEEQLDAWVSGPSSIKKAMDKIEAESDGKVKPEWH